MNTEATPLPSPTDRPQDALQQPATVPAPGDAAAVSGGAQQPPQPGDQVADTDGMAAAKEGERVTLRCSYFSREELRAAAREPTERFEYAPADTPAAGADLRPPPEHEGKPLHWLQSPWGTPEPWAWDTNDESPRRAWWSGIGMPRVWSGAGMGEMGYRYLGPAEWQDQQATDGRRELIAAQQERIAELEASRTETAAPYPGSPLVRGCASGRALIAEGSVVLPHAELTGYMARITELEASLAQFSAQVNLLTDANAALGATNERLRDECADLRAKKPLNGRLAEIAAEMAALPNQAHYDPYPGPTHVAARRIAELEAENKRLRDECELARTDHQPNPDKRVWTYSTQAWVGHLSWDGLTKPPEKHALGFESFDYGTQVGIWVLPAGGTDAVCARLSAKEAAAFGRALATSVEDEAGPSAQVAPTTAKPVATDPLRPGEFVTCEAGHLICEVVAPLCPGWDGVDWHRLGAWRSNADRNGLCECGKRWFCYADPERVAGPRLHIKGRGWV